ncbi:hypothetical protein [Sphingomonas sp.]|uniref:hypothetical protein n=1 Tax=Sphingomonas sp. TaxID=28214 RepID=UPI003CC623CF
MRIGLMMVVALMATPAMAQVAGPGVSRPAAPAPIGAVPQRALINGVLVLYGNERCPTDREGNEVIVCERRSASEQYRVPKELREFVVTPENQSWARHAQTTLADGTGANSIGSCSAVGPGGQTGCFEQQAQNNRATNQARTAQQRRAP